MDTSLPWPTVEVEIPMTTPPKGRPNQFTQSTQKRPHSSPESSQYTTVKSRKQKKAKKKLNAES